MPAVAHQSEHSLDFIYRFRVFLLVATCAVATGLVTSIVDILRLNLPTIAGAFPALSPVWLPFLFLVIWFNGIYDGGGRFQLKISPAVIWFLALICVMGSLEFFHALFADNLPENELIHSLGWICFFWIALQSFSSLAERRSWIIATFAVCSAIAAILMAIFPHEALLQIGFSRFIHSEGRPEVSGVNASAYQFATAALFSLVALIFRRPGVLPPWAWSVLLAVNIFGVVAAKGRGAWLLLIAGVVVSVAGALLSKFWPVRRKVVVAMAAAFVVIVATAFVGAHTVSGGLERILSLGRGFAPAADNRGMQASWASTSIGIRAEMAIKSLSIFATHPIFGKGLAEMTSTRTMGHSVHGVPLRLFAGYGLVGGLLAVIFLWSAFGRGRPQSPESIVAFFAVVLPSMTFESCPFYFAVLLAIPADPQRSDA